MSSEPKITFYDLTSSLKPQVWSPNTYKTRYVLNYKQIPYKTVWTSFPDIESTLVKAGAEGLPKINRLEDPSRLWYTVPAIKDESGAEPVIIIGAVEIAEYLEEKFPDRPVFPKTGKALEHAVISYFDTAVWPKFFMPIMPLTYEILDEKAKPYFYETRTIWFGKKIEEFSPEGAVRDGQWKDLEAGFNTLAAFYDKNGANVDFIAGGANPTFADFYIASNLMWIKCVSREEWKNRGVEQWSNGRWGRLLKRLEEWESPRD
ncbi:hypothetical protein M422DRAFT_32497 [Sphaerobolus stellatus SS14]|uniref:GST N-terminal domain-containing protein n=1 Tax=Sphaerobolus stellatus (strain SS14) TaxID=990650 RepID=A0A0C9VEV3_SPHS4|nr:hypothetical protein M422DRAFT_32497 [Sphaerobolus stellatus SS14]